jgi:hypothetical protein
VEFNIDNVITTQDELVAVQVNKYDQLLSDPNILWWDELTSDFTITKRKRVMNWIQSIAVLRKSAEGASRRYDDQVDASAELTSDDYEASLEVHNHDYADDDLDHAAAWARDIANYEALFWQVLLLELLAQGTVLKGYDDVPFFSANHPVLMNADEGTNKNLWSGYDLTPAGLKALTADIKGTLKTHNLPNGYIRPFRLWLNPQTEFAGAELLGAEIIGNLQADGINGSRTNVLAQKAFKNAFGWDGGVRLMQDHPMEDSYYVECRVMGRSPYETPFVRVIREMIQMRMYTKADQVILGRSNRTEWQKDGRVAMRYGEPMCLHKVTF